MQQLKLNENIDIKPKKGFWRRQFQSEATKSQKIFDWFFGAILPVICFVFDPIVFKSGGFGPSLLGEFKPFAYLLSFVSVMAMSAWLIWGAKLKWLNAFLAGLFLVGGLISFGVGLAILPYSLLGLMILIGALGFTPFFSSIVFLRNAFRAFQSAKPFLDKSVLVRAYVLTAIFSVVVPSIINLEIKRMSDDMENGDAQTIRANAQTLKYVSPIVNFDNLVVEYRRSSHHKDNERMQLISEEYERLTGVNLDHKTRILMD